MYKNKDKNKYLDYYIEMYTKELSDLIHLSTEDDLRIFKSFENLYLTKSKNDGYLSYDVKNSQNGNLVVAINQFCSNHLPNLLESNILIEDIEYIEKDFELLKIDTFNLRIDQLEDDDMITPKSKHLENFTFKASIKPKNLTLKPPVDCPIKYFNKNESIKKIKHLLEDIPNNIYQLLEVFKPNPLNRISSFFYNYLQEYNPKMQSEEKHFDQYLTTLCSEYKENFLKRIENTYTASETHQELLQYLHEDSDFNSAIDKQNCTLSDLYNIIDKDFEVDFINYVKFEVAKEKLRRDLIHSANKYSDKIFSKIFPYKSYYQLYLNHINTEKEIENSISHKTTLVSQDFLYSKEELNLKYKQFLIQLTQSLKINALDNSISVFIQICIKLLLLTEIKVLFADKVTALTLCENLIYLNNKRYFSQYLNDEFYFNNTTAFHIINTSYSQLLYESYYGHINKQKPTVEHFKYLDIILENTFKLAIDGLNNFQFNSIIIALYNKLEIPINNIISNAKGNLEQYSKYMHDFITNVNTNKDDAKEDITKKINAFTQGEHFLSFINELKIMKIDDKDIFIDLAKVLIDAFIEESILYLVDAKLLKKTKTFLKKLQKESVDEDLKQVEKYIKLFNNRNTKFTYFPIVYLAQSFHLSFNYTYNFAHEIALISIANEKGLSDTVINKKENRNMVKKDAFHKQYCILSKIIFPYSKANNQTQQTDCYESQGNLICCDDVEIKT